jgi:hypothetical protein
MASEAENVTRLMTRLRAEGDAPTIDSLEAIFRNMQIQLANLNNTDAVRLDSVDLTNEQSVTAFVNREKINKTYKETMAVLSRVVRTAILTGKISKLTLHNPTVSQEMKYWREIDEVKENTSEGQRALQQIPIFTGDSIVSWVSFEHPWMIAIKNKNLSETTLRTALVSKLQGPAGMYYLSLDRVERLGFAEVMEKMRERYTRDSTSAVNAVSTMFQKQNEQVLDFNARILLAGRGLLPIPPKELSVISYPRSEYTLPNPMFSDQEREYEMQHKASLNLLTRYFLSGLRGDIKDRVASDKYTDYQDLVNAAVKAEWMKDSVFVSSKVHHVQQKNDTDSDNNDEDEEQAEANVLRGQSKFKGKNVMTKKRPQSHPYKKELYKKEFIPPQTKGEIRKATKQDQCFYCQKYGHFSKDCFSKKKGKSNFRMKVNQSDFQVFQQMKKRNYPKGKVHFTQADEYYDPEENDENENQEESDAEDEYEIVVYDE